MGHVWAFLRVILVISALIGGRGASAQITADPAPVIEEVFMGTEAGLQEWIAAFRTRALSQGISAATLDTAMAGRHFLPDVLDKDLHQNEFTKTIWDYLDKAVSDDRIAAGKAALAKYATTLDAIEARYGVDRQFVVAIWGLESAYGQVRGDIPTLDALATLAYGSRRAAYFEGELLNALRIVQAGDVAPAQMRGSWAGAMGHTQFMPSSFLTLAVDFDGDGRRDIWGDDPGDALASTAAYLAASHWIKGAPWGVEVTLPAGFDVEQAGLRTQKPMAFWAKQGVVAVAGQALPPTGWAALLLPGGARGAAFLVFDNFAAIESYNVADAYVIAVGHLADRIMGGAAIAHDWPRDLRALTLEERMDLQDRLTKAGFNAGGTDGKIGPLTIAAIKGFQKSRGLVPDGFASTEVLALLPNLPR